MKKYETAVYGIVKSELPNVKNKDIATLIKMCRELSETAEGATLDDWMPSRHYILELLGFIARNDLETAIEDFRMFAKSKNWTVGDNLGQKLITHSKIMLANGRLTAQAK